MNEHERIGHVIDLACLTEDRDGAEQRALIDTALRLDLDRGAFTIANRRPAPPEYLARVMVTYRPSEGRRVRPTRAQLDQARQLAERWRTCPKCSCPMGAHGADNRCPR